MSPFSALHAVIAHLADPEPGGGSGRQPTAGMEGWVLRSADGPPLTNVIGSLRSLTPGVVVLTGEASFSDLPAGGMATNLAPFSYRVDKGVACGTPAVFELVATAHGHRFTNSFQHPLGQLMITNLTAGAFAAPVPSPNPGVSIPDLGMVVVTNEIPVEGRVLDLAVWLRIDHPATGDLEAVLESPDGTRVHLISRRDSYRGLNFGSGECGEALLATVMDDAAPTALSGGIAPFVGSFRPAEPLSAFDGRGMFKRSSRITRN